MTHFARRPPPQIALPPRWMEAAMANGHFHNSSGHASLRNSLHALKRGQWPSSRIRRISLKQAKWPTDATLHQHTTASPAINAHLSQCARLSECFRTHHVQQRGQTFPPTSAALFIRLFSRATTPRSRHVERESLIREIPTPASDLRDITHAPEIGAMNARRFQPEACLTDRRDDWQMHRGSGRRRRHVCTVSVYT